MALLAAVAPLGGCFIDSIFGSSEEGTGGTGPATSDGGVTTQADGTAPRPYPGTDGGATTTDADYVIEDGGVVYMDVWYPLPDGAASGGDGSTSSSGPTLSGPLGTNQMTADMSAQSYGATLNAYATLRHDKYPGDPNPDDVLLSDGDTLTAQLGGSGTPVTMIREPGTPGYTVRYVASFQNPQTTAPFDVIIAFGRTNGKYGAPYSKVTLAAPFAITTPPPASFTHGAMLTLRVSPAVDANVAAANLEAWGGCIQSYFAAQPFDGTGTTTFDSSKLQFAGGEPPAAGCDVTMRVRADSSGQVDSAFQRGTFGGIAGMPGLEAREAPTHMSP